MFKLMLIKLVRMNTLSPGSEARYPIFNGNGVGFFSNNGNGWGIGTRQNFSTPQDIQNFTVTPSGNPTRPVQSHLEWQNQFFVGPANNYQASPNKK